MLSKAAQQSLSKDAMEVGEDFVDTDDIQIKSEVGSGGRLQGLFSEDKGTCSQCARRFTVSGDTKRDSEYPDLCRKCAGAKRQLIKQRRRDNSNWMRMAVDEGVPPWERQPEETADEFELWTIYRDMWPDARPTLPKVMAIWRDNGGQSVDVTRAAQRWTWSARLQAWIREVNSERTAELRAARRQMVEDHITIGEKLRAKVLVMVDNLDAFDVTPGELVQLLKVTSEFEKTARDSMDAVERATADDIDLVDTFGGSQGSGAGLSGSDGNASGLSLEDAAEVMKILVAAGVAQGRSAAAAQQSETRSIEAEVVDIDEDDMGDGGDKSEL